MSEGRHPRPEEILAWAAGHLETPLHEEIEAHLASCTSPCGHYATICLDAAADVDVQGEPSPDRVSLEELLRVQQEARALMEGPAERWGTMVLHPDRTSSMFVLEVAERLVYYADEKPVLGGLADMRRLVESLRAADREEALSLGFLAEGVFRRAQGDHAAAIACYGKAEALIIERPTSLVYARICVQRAFSLRALRHVDAARRELVLAGQVFARCGVNGSGVVLWELANLAWQEGAPRRALSLARQASSAFSAEGDLQQARMALHTAASALISLRRPRAAARLLDGLERGEGLGPYERGLVSWKRGKILALLGRGQPEGLRELEAAADLLSSSPLAAAEVLVDRAVLAGELGAVATQLDSASRAVALLSKLPAPVGELAIALRELQAALAAQGAVAEILVRIRGLIAR